MVETYKYKSKIATGIAFIATFILFMGKDGLTEIMPQEYAYLIPIIVFIAAYILAQSTENKRVNVAEQMIIEKYNQPTTRIQQEIFDNDAPVERENNDI